ncbi:MAG: PEP-utilizing enzyme [Planctomycetota bacterium]
MDRAARAGLPVPEGYLVELGDDPAAAARALHVAFGPASVGVPPRRGTSCRIAVRSAFAVEDGRATSNAGAFLSVLGVDPREPGAVAEAIEEVRASAASRDVGRADVLVQRQIEAVRAGVAFTETDHEDDLVDSIAGLADGLLAGRIAGDVWELPKLRPEDLLGGPRSTDPVKLRVQLLLRRVRRVFGAADLDVEWADDGQRVHLVQVRPITAAPLRDEWFTVANHREILPELPSVAMTSVLAEASGRLYGWYRRHDAALPARRLFVEVFAGRPRINLGLLNDTVRILGLPTRLVTDSIGGGGTDGPPVQPLRWGRVVRRTPTLLRLLRSQLGAVRAARAAEQEFDDILRRLGPEPDLDAIGAGLSQVYVALVHAMFGLTAAMSGPLSTLRKTGTLEPHAAGHRTVTTRMWEELDAVRDALAPDDRASCADGRRPTTARGSQAFDAWMERWGHRGIFESDVARPRFVEDPAPVIRALASPSGARRARPSRGWMAHCTAPLWWAARGPLAAREELRDRAMRSFRRLRALALERAARLVVAGRLPDADAIWHLTLADWRALEHGVGLDDAQLVARRSEQQSLSALRLHDVFRRRDPLGAADSAADGTDTRSLRGLGLTRGTFEGTAVVLAEPGESLPAGVDPRSAILIAPAIDAGWVPLLTTVGGVVVEIGGELSHGSILVREVGLPAVTNVAGAGSVLRTGDRIRLDGSTGQVERLVVP